MAGQGDRDEVLDESVHSCCFSLVQNPFPQPVAFKAVGCQMLGQTNLLMHEYAFNQLRVSVFICYVRSRFNERVSEQRDIFR